MSELITAITSIAAEKRIKPTVLAVVGPTASGKTALSVALAKRLDGEIISCDSMQIYKRMDIGTAKPTAEEMQGIPHYMIDIAEPENEFSSADFATLAAEHISDISSLGKLPIICGGTGLYLDTLLRGDTGDGGGADPEYRAYMTALAAEKGADYVYSMLCEKDPESAEAIHPNNVKRVIRALEVYHVTGRKKSELDRLSKQKESPYDACIIGIRYADRQKLYDRIDRRVDIMISEGLENEVRALDRDGIFEKSRTACQAIGYKEMLGFVRGEMPLDICVDELKRATRRYAKRQMTWFGSHGNVRWIDADTPTDDGRDKTFEDIVNIAEKLFSEYGYCDII